MMKLRNLCLLFLLLLTVPVAALAQGDTQYPGAIDTRYTLPSHADNCAAYLPEPLSAIEMTTMSVSSTSCIPVLGAIIQIDNEMIYVAVVDGLTLDIVQRGWGNTMVRAHASKATVRVVHSAGHVNGVRNGLIEAEKRIGTGGTTPLNKKLLFGDTTDGSSIWRFIQPSDFGGTPNGSKYLRDDLTWATVATGITGSGTSGKLARWTGSGSMGDSIISESSGVATTTGRGHSTKAFSADGGFAVATAGGFGYNTYYDPASTWTNLDAGQTGLFIRFSSLDAVLYSTSTGTNPTLTERGGWKNGGQRFYQLGYGAFGTTVDTNNELTVQPWDASLIGVVVRGAVSQGGDLQQWQNSSGTVLAKVDKNGRASFEEVSGKHFVGLGAAPSLTVSGGCGTGATATLSATSTDVAGTVTLNTTTVTSNCRVTISFATPYTDTPAASFSAASPQFAGVSGIYMTGTASDATLFFPNNPPDDEEIVFHYQFIQ